MALHHSELMFDLLSHLPDRPNLGVDENIRLAVESLALVQEFADTMDRVGGVQERAVGLLAHAVPDGIGRSPEAGDESACFQANQIVGMRNQPSAGSDDRPLHCSDLFEDVTLEFSKRGFTVISENCTDRFSGATFDEIVRIPEIEPQHACQSAANRSFAGSHKTDQSDVVDAAFCHGWSSDEAECNEVGVRC